MQGCTGLNPGQSMLVRGGPSQQTNETKVSVQSKCKLQEFHPITFTKPPILLRDGTLFCISFHVKRAPPTPLWRIAITSSTRRNNLLTTTQRRIVFGMFSLGEDASRIIELPYAVFHIYCIQLISFFKRRLFISVPLFRLASIGIIH